MRDPDSTSPKQKAYHTTKKGRILILCDQKRCPTPKRPKDPRKSQVHNSFSPIKTEELFPLDAIDVVYPALNPIG
jgi:hypothetical protein